MSDIGTVGPLVVGAGIVVHLRVKLYTAAIIIGNAVSSDLGDFHATHLNAEVVKGRFVRIPVEY